MRPPLLAVSICLVLATLACAGHVFQATRLYAQTPIPPQQAYNASSDTILSDNVWVFRPDGTFGARLSACGTPLQLSGTYSGDDVGSGAYYLFLDMDADGEPDDHVQLDVQNDGYSFIDWQCAGETVRFLLLR